jgi:hypothetical protein
LDAELAGFAALLTHHRDTDPDEQPEGGQPQVAS